MDPFETITIGNTGVCVTRLGLGGAGISGMTLADGIYKGSAFDEALNIIQSAYDIGIRHFDTAPLYGMGRSESRYGHVLSQKPRDSFSLATKVSRRLVLTDHLDFEPHGEDRIPNYTYEFDFSATGIRDTLSASLERLRVESVDIVYLHDSDKADQHSDQLFCEGLDALTGLRESGIVKAIGMGMNQWQLTARMIERYNLDIVLLAGRYTLLDQSALPEFMPLCQERGVRLSIGGPYNSGILARDLDQPVSFEYQPASPNIVERARNIKKICDQHGVSLKATALQFVLAHPAVATVIPGATTLAEVDDNVRVVQEILPASLWDNLKSDGLLPQNAPTPE